ncbi:MAG: hypothetical protein QNJ87_02565 [Gammaproteobacteria bacterium]|nr:hypothetical protein [Gammaproteobacteria bacterium]
MRISHSLAVLPALLITLLLSSHAPVVNAEPVYACASRYFGFMRLVKHPRKCRRRERLVTFPGAGGDSGSGDQQARIEALEAQNESLSVEVDALKESNADLKEQLQALEQTDEAMDVEIAGLKEANAFFEAEMQQAPAGGPGVLPEKLACISDQSTATDLIFEGCNVRIRNGLGATDSLNGLGLGNLIIGYDEDGSGGKDRTGSHNLVVGSEHIYSSFGGLVAGHNNSITGANATVAGGSFNRATGPKASITGGFDNLAGGDAASVVGGAGNKATGSQATVSGGLNNEAVSSLSSVSGGAGNQAAMGKYPSVSGGFQNVAAGDGASVSGGTGNTAWGTQSSVLGGENKTAAGSNESLP